MRFHLIIINSELEWGITSRELALELGRKHKNILRDIRVFLSRKSLSYGVFNFEEEKTYWKNRSGQLQYVLTKKATEDFLRLRRVRKSCRRLNA